MGAIIVWFKIGWMTGQRRQRTGEGGRIYGVVVTRVQDSVEGQRRVQVVWQVGSVHLSRDHGPMVGVKGAVRGDGVVTPRYWGLGRDTVPQRWGHGTLPVVRDRLPRADSAFIGGENKQGLLSI